MFRSRFFWRLFLPYAVLLVLSLGATGWIVVRRYHADQSAQLAESLRIQAVALGHLAVGDFRSSDVDWAVEVQSLASLTGNRVTLIRHGGTVVADSVADPSAMDNHADRPEVRRALASGLGTFQRHSVTVGEEMLYVASSPRGEDTGDGAAVAGVVRVAAPTSAVEAQVQRMRGLFVTAAVLALIAALALGAFAVRRVATPIEQMRQVAERMGRGDYNARYAGSKTDELGVLGGTLNQLGDEMSERVADLTAGQDRLRAMVAGMVEGVVAVDDEDRVTFTNHTAVRMLGLDAEAESRGDRLWEAARVPDLTGLLSEARRSDAAAQRELALIVAGREIMVRAQAHRFTDGERLGVVVVLHDITELRRLERIRRDFVANVSHELKTPLTSIRGFVETLLDGAVHDDENNVRFLEKIEHNVSRLSHLVTDLLSLARIESQEGGLTLERVDVQGLIEQASRRHESTATGKDQTLRLETCTGSVQVLGDREGLTQVIDNLVDNAIKYTPPSGHVTLRLTREAGHAVIEVEDDGIGIPAEDQDRVFERFYRVDKARSREVGGTGLGLSIVKHLVIAMGGDISVASEVGEGTTFRVRLQLA